jgi:hypothetical protein
MLVSATNRVLITNSGHTILQSLVTSHPGVTQLIRDDRLAKSRSHFELCCVCVCCVVVCRLLISSITAHSARFGDSATALTLMTHAALTHITALCESDGRSSTAPLSSRGSGIEGVESASLSRSHHQLRSATHSDAAQRRFQRHVTALYQAFTHLQKVWFEPVPSASPSASASSPAQSLLAEYLQQLSYVAPPPSASTSTASTDSDSLRPILTALLRTTFCTFLHRFIVSVVPNFLHFPNCGAVL